ncbi:MAG: hypothetical protein OXU23_12765 [Candidatus Poribacteria bacterium]|nr:hypothetical protein [Candidatus Poribacteria bacterium]
MNFWEPIRNGGGVFSGPPVPHERGHIGKQTRNIEVCLHVNNGDCYVRVWFDRKKTENTSERRDRIKDLFRCSEYKYEDADTEEYRTLIFPVCNKGKNDRDDWDEIRDKLVNMGTDIYSIIDRSGL